MTTAETKGNLLKDFPPKESQRYDDLQKTLQLALENARTRFNVEDAMTTLYEDADQFGGKATLQTIFEDSLEKIDREVLPEMDKFCKEQKIPQLLLTLDSIALKLDKEREWNEYVDQQDRLSAQKALERATLPDNTTIEQVQNFTEYTQLSTEQAKLEEELAKVQAEIAELEQANQHIYEGLEPKLRALSELNTQMEKAADATSKIAK